MKGWLGATGAIFFAVATAACARHPRWPDAAAGAPFIREFGLVFVELDGRDGPPLLALLDTGANASAIDPRVAGNLAVLRKTEVVGTTRTVAAEIVGVEGLRLGGWRLPPLRATRRDLTGLLAPAGRKVDLILGTDAFEGAALTIDFDGARLEVRRGSSPGGGKGVPMILDNGIPAIAGELGGLGLELRIDTGASLFETKDVYVNVPPRAWSVLHAENPLLAASTHFEGTGADGSKVTLPVVPISGVRIGPLSIGSAFLIVQPEAGYFATPEAKGFVGNNYLEKLHRVTFDFRSGRLLAGR